SRYGYVRPRVIFGVASVPGEATAGATVDSRERYYGAIFLGYGLAWVWASRQRPVPATAVRWLAWIFLLRAVGRLISLALIGTPQWFQVVLTVVELVLPPVFFWLASADERAVAVHATRPDP
ncbi:MAG: DUF4345 domain-containing protein, partial [Lapillicoccus sp.]